MNQRPNLLISVFVMVMIFIHFNVGVCLAIDLDDGDDQGISNADDFDNMLVNEKFVKIRAKQQMEKRKQNNKDGSIIVNKSALTIYNYVDSKEDIKAVGRKGQKVTAAGSVIINKGARVQKVVNVIKTKKSISAVGGEDSEVSAAGSIVVRKGAKVKSTKNVVKAKNIEAINTKGSDSDSLTFSDDF